MGYSPKCLEGEFSEVTALMKGLGVELAPNPRRDIYACLPPTPILGQLPPYRPVQIVGRVDVYIVVLGVLEDVQSHLALHGCATAGEAARRIFADRYGRREVHDHVTGLADSALVDVRARGG
jgi:hypothetical protein